VSPGDEPLAADSSSIERDAGVAVPMSLAEGMGASGRGGVGVEDGPRSCEGRGAANIDGPVDVGS
jgi:hypothetical protein